MERQSIMEDTEWSIGDDKKGLASFCTHKNCLNRGALCSKTNHVL